MNVYALYVRPVMGCAGTGLISLVAWFTLDGIELGAVLGAMFVCALLFIFTAVHEHRRHRTPAAWPVEQPTAPVENDDLDFDEPVFDHPQRVVGDDW